MNKRTEKLPNTPLSLDFVNKPSLSNKPPSVEGQKLSKPPQGLRPHSHGNAIVPFYTSFRSEKWNAQGLRSHYPGYQTLPKKKLRLKLRNLFFGRVWYPGYVHTGTLEITSFRSKKCQILKLGAKL